MPVDPGSNPLNDFVDNTAGTNSIQLPDHPSLEEHVRAHGFAKGIQVYDQKVKEHWQQISKIINERVQGKSPVSDSKL